MPDDGYSNEPICPIIGRMVGNGSSGPGLKETWRTWEALMMEWIAPRSYVASILLSVMESVPMQCHKHTAVLIAVDGVGRPLRVCEGSAHRAVLVYKDQRSAIELSTCMNYTRNEQDEAQLLY